MIRIAITEDEDRCVEMLRTFTERFFAARSENVSIEVFRNGITLIDNYSGKYDLIFLDIQMPHMDGMEAAHRIRELDPDVILIFVTSLAQYAVDGYTVSALDYILKPVTYPEFSIKLSRAMDQLQQRATSVLSVPTENGTIKLAADEIYYCEVINHRLISHTKRGVFDQYGSLRDAEDRLPKDSFVRCNYCYLVNLDYISELESDMVTLSDGDYRKELSVSRSRKKALEKAFLEHVEKGGRA